MSGRVRVSLPDGRRVTGYRKTLRRQSPRTPPHEAPELRLAFLLPKRIVAFVPAGSYGPVEIGPIGNATITMRTFDRERLFRAAAWFLSHHTPEGSLPYSVTVDLTSSSEPDWLDRWRISYLDGGIVATKSPIDPFLYPKAA